MKSLLQAVFAAGLGELVSSKSKKASEDDPYMNYENYSFEYSSHRMPIAYKSIGNSVELHNSVKLNSKVPKRGGAYVLEKALKWDNFEIDVRFRIMSDPDAARGFEIILSEHEMEESQFE